MDNLLPITPTISISDGIIENITSDNSTTFVTVSYDNCINCNQTQQRIRLVVNNNTRIFDERGNLIPVTDLRTDMIVNATSSSVMTRSIPPQANAFLIRVRRRPLPDNNTTGRIINIDNQNRSFTTLSAKNQNSVTRFNVPIDALILDRIGRPMDFSQLFPGLQVRIRHAEFMTASIPPQTIAFEIRVI